MVGMPRLGADREQGMTLLEMLVAMVIMVMVGALAFPALENAIAALSFRRSVDLVESDLRYARAAAISRQRPIFIILSRDGHAYGAGGGPSRQAPAGIAYAATPAEIGFFPDGSSSGGTFIVLGGGQRRQLVIDPVTGSIASGAQ